MNFNIFKRILKSKETKLFSRESMQVVVEKNRNSLHEIPTWLNQEAFDNSYYNYGVPENIKSLLDLEIGDEMTYSDLIMYYSKQIKKVNYLELGVSVGKNFFQMANGFNNAMLTGFDIENIHPSLQSKFTFIDRLTWEGKADSLRKELSSLSNYNFKTNSVSYIAGDIWDERCWAQLEGKKFNVIFYDALHNPEALLWEYKMIEKYKLLDIKFILAWDDLNNGLESSFYKIAESLKKNIRLTERHIQLIKVNGWLGQNYPIKHDFGIITNISLK